MFVLYLNIERWKHLNRHMFCAVIFGMKLGCQGYFLSPVTTSFFVKQSLNIEMPIVFARVSGGPQQHKTQQCSPHFSTVFCVKNQCYRIFTVISAKDVAADMDMVVFPNYVS